MNIHWLKLTDAILYIKKKPDTNIEVSFKRFLTINKNFMDKEINTLVRLALKYPPATRALLGALLEQLQQGKATEPLLKSLNPITKYKLTGSTKALPTTEKMEYCRKLLYDIKLFSGTLRAASQYLDNKLETLLI